MKKMMAAALAASAFVVSTPALAATTITLGPDGSNEQFGTFSITAFTAGTGLFDDFVFNVPGMGVVGADATATISIATGNGIELTSIVLNGVQALASLNSTGTSYVASLNSVATKDNPQTLRVNYNVNTRGTASGTVSWSAQAAVPEPATWALMILGFGVVGYAMRRRPTVRFAQAI